MLSRWGSNLYWYNLVEIDKNVYVFLCKYFLLHSLIKIFFLCGITIPKTNPPFFVKGLGASKWEVFLSKKFLKINLLYVDNFPYHPKPLIIPSRVWLLNFCNWIVIIFYTFSKIQFLNRSKAPVFFRKNLFYNNRAKLNLNFWYKSWQLPMNISINRYIF